MQIWVERECRRISCRPGTIRCLTSFLESGVNSNFLRSFTVCQLPPRLNRYYILPQPSLCVISCRSFHHWLFVANPISQSQQLLPVTRCLESNCLKYVRWHAKWKQAWNEAIGKLWRGLAITVIHDSSISNFSVTRYGEQHTVSSYCHNLFQLKKK